MYFKTNKALVFFFLFSLLSSIACNCLIKFSGSSSEIEIAKEQGEEDNEDSSENESDETNELFSENPSFIISIAVINLHHSKTGEYLTHYFLQYSREIIPPPPKSC